ncbi:MAG TPA: hemerythrin domain-containing protein [Saprospiraceae bacterium]|nr:hemerythrin domain-containing protein [Saprospiraceae bacterium]
MEKRKPLKRDPALIPLSREHHKGLILAQLLKSDVPNYKGLPDDIPGKVAFAKTEYEQRLKTHFEREESWLIPLCQGKNKNLREMAQRIHEEHNQIREKITQLNEQSTPETLDQLGRLIESHIRFEEREWFQALQEQKVL